MRTFPKAQRDHYSKQHEGGRHKQNCAARKQHPQQLANVQRRGALGGRFLSVFLQVNSTAARIAGIAAGAYLMGPHEFARFYLMHMLLKSLSVLFLCRLGM